MTWLNARDMPRPKKLAIGWDTSLGPHNAYCLRRKMPSSEQRVTASRQSIGILLGRSRALLGCLSPFCILIALSVRLGGAYRMISRGFIMRMAIVHDTLNELQSQCRHHHPRLCEMDTTCTFHTHDDDAAASVQISQM